MEREKVIRILKYYNDIDGHIAFARSVLAEYEDRYYGLHGGKPLEVTSSKSNKISNPTEVAALNIPDSASQTMDSMRTEIKQLGKLQAQILTEISKLSLVEKNILTYFYFKNYKWVQISRCVNYSGTQCKIIRNKALEKLGNFFDKNVLIKKFNYRF